MNILLIEDNRDLAENLIIYLERRDYVVDWAGDGITGLHLAVTSNPDLIVLDLNLPGISGLEICKKLRQEARSSVHIIMLTAQDSIDDKVAGLELGADDYLVKPFDMKELDARIRAVCRRSMAEGSNAILEFGSLKYDPLTMEFTRAGELLKLSPIPHKILTVLIAQKNQVVKKEKLLREVWPDDLPNSDSLRTHIHALRQILDKPYATPMLTSVTGIGYRLISDV